MQCSVSCRELHDGSNVACAVAGLYQEDICSGHPGRIPFRLVQNHVFVFVELSVLQPAPLFHVQHLPEPNVFSSSAKSCTLASMNSLFMDLFEHP